MDTNTEQYLSAQPLDRQSILTNIHAIIIKEDTTVIPVIEPMMGKEMIIYKYKNSMKYALASVKNYMSLHVLPIYGSSTLYAKYQLLLDKASFQKGCINFNTEEEIPFDIVRQLISECSHIDLVKIREAYLKEKKEKAKSKK